MHTCILIYEVLIIKLWSWWWSKVTQSKQVFFSSLIFTPSSACIAPPKVFKYDYLSLSGSLKRQFLNKKSLMEKLLSPPHLPIILLSLARDFYESKKIFSVVYPNVKREGEKVFYLHKLFFSRRRNLFLWLQCFACTERGFLFFILPCLKRFSDGKWKCKRDLVYKIK